MAKTFPIPDRHLTTDHLTRDIGRRALSGGMATMVAQGLKFGMNLGGVIVLARLLSPEDFGLVAMAGALMPILRTFREGGFSTAAIQKQTLTQAQASNLFWVNVLLGTIITGIGVAAAPLVSWFYRDQHLEFVAIILSTSFLFSGLSTQHMALLNRQMRFTAIAVIDVASTLLGFAAGVACAWNGMGYWALVIMQLTTSILESLLTWLASGWRPHLPKRGTETKPLLHFGASMTFYILLRRLASGIDVILLGRLYGSVPVGLYSRAQALLLRPLDQFISPFDTVFIPLLSRLQDDRHRYREVFLDVYGAIALISFVFAGILSGVSKPLVAVLLGPNWQGAAPIFAWLTLAALYLPLSKAGIWLLSTQGRSRDLVKMGLVGPGTTVVSILIGLPFGAIGVAISVAIIGLLVRLPIQYYITGRIGSVSRADLWNVFFSHLPLWLIVTATTHLVSFECSAMVPSMLLLMGTVAGSLAAVAIVVCSARLRREVQFLFQQINRIRTGKDLRKHSQL